MSGSYFWPSKELTDQILTNISNNSFSNETLFLHKFLYLIELKQSPIQSPISLWIIYRLFNRRVLMSVKLH